MRVNDVRYGRNPARIFRPIERPRLYERLSAAARYRIVTVVAPAGFGKSVALRHFVRRRPRAVLYEVSQESKTLLQFVRGFCDALARHTPGLRAALASAFEGFASSAIPGKDLASWAAVHMRELRVMIVIDNLDMNDADPEISHFLANLIGKTKAHTRWCLASRARLNLPTASWLAYNESDLGLDADDLRFTPEEARLIATAAGARLSDEDLDTMFRLTEGWPAALTFAFRNATKAQDLQSLTDATRDIIYRYLAEQVWHSLDTQLQRFLGVAAFLPWIDTTFAAEAGFPNSETVIENLRARIGLISTRDGGVYELHDLFRDFVRKTLSSRGALALQEALICAGGVLERTGFTAAAIDRYVDADAAGSIARVLEYHNMALLESGHYDVAQRAIRALKDSAEFGRGGVLALRAALEEAHGRVDRAEALYARALSIPSHDQSFCVTISCRYSLLLYQQGRTDGIALLETLFNRSDLSASDQAHVAGTLAVLLAYAGDQARASATLSDALLLAEETDESVRARTYGRAAAVAFFAGDEHSVELYANEAARLAEDCSLYGLAARIGTSLSALHTSAGRIAIAKSYAARIVSNAERAGDPEVRARGLRELMALEAELGNEDAALSAERELATTAYTGPNGLTALLLARAMILTWNSRFREATLLLQDADTWNLSSHQHRLRTSLLAVAAAANRDIETALSALSAYESAANVDSDTHSMFARARALSLRYAMLAAAIIAKRDISQRLTHEAARGETLDAFKAFDDAIEAVKLHSEQRLVAALHALNAHSQQGTAKVIAAVTAGLFPSEIGDHGPLTTTETAVLRSLAKGLSNQAIASAQGRTVNTIRTHVSSILRKLKCESRGEAAAAARRLGLV